MPLSEPPFTTMDKVTLYRTIRPLLSAMYKEFKDLSKKKPDGVLSKSKVKVVNRLIAKCCETLEEEPSYEFLDLLDEDDVPQYSDVVIALSQYEASIIAFYDKYCLRTPGGGRSWNVN